MATKRTYLERSESAKKAAATRNANVMKRTLDSIPAVDPGRYSSLGATPAERQAVSHQQKIAEIQKSDADAKARAAEKRKNAAKKAAETKAAGKRQKQGKVLVETVRAIKAATEDKGVELLQGYFK